MNWCFPEWESKNLRNPQATYSHRKWTLFIQRVHVYIQVIPPWLMAKDSYFISLQSNALWVRSLFRRNVLHSQLSCAIYLADEHLKCMQTLKDKLWSIICPVEDTAKWQQIIYCRLQVLKTTASVALHLTRKMALFLHFVHLEQSPILCKCNRNNYIVWGTDSGIH